MKRVYTVLLVCAVVLLAASPVAAKDKWISLKTKYFNITSNAAEGDTRELAVKLEQFRSILSKLTNSSTASPVPITVVVFKSDSSFKPFKPLYNGKPANLSGFFQRNEDENIIALDINARVEDPAAVIFHEYTHLLTAYRPKRLPLWLSEGLAELYSTFDVKKNEVTIGKPITRHVLSLRENKFVPFQTLFSVGHDSSVYNERDKKGIFYAESWALAHYLMMGNKFARQPQLGQFLKLLDAGASVERAFTEAFKTDFATMEKELRNYIGKDSYTGMIYTMNSMETDKEMTIKPMSDAEVAYNLGNLLMRIDRMDEAEPYFNQAAALDASLAGPSEGRGFIAMRRNKYDEATNHLKQAVALGSQNHLVHYYYAESMHRELMGDRDSISIMQPDSAKAIIDELKASIKLMPGFAPAYNLLAFVHLVSGQNLNEGVAAIQTALKLEPQNKRLSLTLAQLQVRAQKYEEAKKTLAPLLAGEDQTGLRQSAQSIMSMIDSYTRPDISAGTTRNDEPVSEPAEDQADRPRLKRRGESSSSPPPPTSPPEPAVTSGRGPTGKPTLKLEGTQVMRGTLAVWECEPGSMVLAVRSGERLLRFKVSDPIKLQFYTHDPQSHPEIKCGPINLAAFIYYKPVSEAGTQFAGDAVAVEFAK